MLRRDFLFESGFFKVIFSQSFEGIAFQTLDRLR